MRVSLKLAAAVAVIATLASPALADLEPRLGGLAVYDTDRDITWLTNGDINGRMSWVTAVAWAENLEFAGFTDWRLPRTPDVDWTCTDDPTGTHGFNCRGSEMGHLFYDELGGVAGQSIQTSTDPDLALFTNLRADRYWSGSRSDYAPTHAWTFWFESGKEDPTNESLGRYALAVRDGDVNTTPVARAGVDQFLECAGPGGTFVELDGSLSSDADGDTLAFEWAVPVGSGVVLDDPASATPSGLFPLGPTLVTLTVTDGKGGVDADDVLIVVEDSTPPVLICTTDRIALWPPRHQMVEVEISVIVSDACSTPAAMTVSCTVESSEPDDAKGDGAFTGDVDGKDGHTDPVPVTLAYDSTKGAFVGTVALRAERDGSGEGRVYSIVCDVEDASGNSGSASCVVVVPHDKRKK